MNEEEKKTIERFVEKCNKFDESVEIKGVSVGEEYRILETVCKALDLVEKLQKENEEKNKIIDLMSEQLTTPIHSKEWVKEYYKKIAKEL